MDNILTILYISFYLCGRNLGADIILVTLFSDTMTLRIVFYTFYKEECPRVRGKHLVE